MQNENLDRPIVIDVQYMQLWITPYGCTHWADWFAYNSVCILCVWGGGGGGEGGGVQSLCNRIGMGGTLLAIT